jgi:hypothetical protein
VVRGERLVLIGSAVQGDARQHAEQVQPGCADACPWPVDEEDAVVGEQDVVGTQVGVQQGGACRVGDPGGFQFGECVEMTTGPVVEAVGEGGVARHGAPGGELGADPLGKRWYVHSGRGEGRGQVGHRREHPVEFVGTPGLGGQVAVHVLEDKRHPVVGVVTGEQPRRRGVLRQQGGDAGFAAVDAR